MWVSVSSALSLNQFWHVGRVLYVINHAKFQLNRFRGFGAPTGRKSLSPIDWRYRPYNSVHTNVLHCDVINDEIAF